MDLRLALALPLALWSCSDPHVLRVGIDPDAYPMEYRQDDRSLAGFDIDLMRALGEAEGLKVEFVEGSWPGLFAKRTEGGLLAGLDSKTYDAVASSALITSERRVQYLVSEPYLDAGQVLAVYWDSPANVLDDLNDSTVGVLMGSAGADIVHRTFNARRDQMRFYERLDQALDDLVERRIGGVVAGRVELAGAFGGNELFKAGLRLTGPVLTPDADLGIFVKSGNDALLAKINDGLAKLKASGQYDALLDRWALK